MDVAGKALSEFLSKLSSSSNVWPNDMASMESEHSNRRRIRKMDTAASEWALHQLLASNKCTPFDLSRFLDQRDRQLGKTEQQGWHDKRYRCQLDNQPLLSHNLAQQSLHGATALHLAVYRNSVHLEKIIRLLVDHDNRSKSADTSVRRSKGMIESTVSIPMRCGTYPLHVLTGQSASINEEALKVLANADPTVIVREDVNGDNPMSLLWKNTLRFRWAISIMEGEPRIDYIDRNNASSWMTITTPYKYIRCTLQLVRAYHQKENLSFHDICALPRCPPLLVMLAMLPAYKDDVGVDGSLYSLDEHGRLPLHYAVRSAPANYKCVPEYLHSSHHQTLVSMLLDIYPEGLAAKDDLGRLPLHYALENGCMQEFDLMRMVQMYPPSLKVQDPVSGLYPFMLVAKYPGPSVTNHFERETIELSNRLTEWKVDHVRMSFLLLSLCPEALQYHQRTGFANQNCDVVPNEGK